MRPAHAADQFVDSVGLCTHLESAPYTRYFDAVLRMGASLGVRHFRDEVRPTNDTARWRRLFAEAGIRSHLLVSPATNTVQEMLDFVHAIGPDAVSAIEGQNEGDSPWFKTQAAAKPDWADAVIRYQRDVFQSLQEHVETTAIPVVSPTVLDYQPNDMRRLQPLAPFCQIVGLHAYLQGQQEPETHDAYAGIDWYLSAMRDPFKPQAPAMVTETGYASGDRGISRQAAGIYLPRLLLHLFERGIVRSFLYELMDEGDAPDDPEQSYGLLNPLCVPQPAFHALRLLLGALADPGPLFVPPPIALAVEQAPADFRLLPFRKRDGEAVVAAWRAVRVWDPVSRRDLDVAPASIRLKLPPGSTAATLLLAEGATWLPALVRDRRLSLTLKGTVTLVRLSE